LRRFWLIRTTAGRRKDGACTEPMSTKSSRRATFRAISGRCVGVWREIMKFRHMDVGIRVTSLQDVWVCGEK